MIKVEKTIARDSMFVLGYTCVNMMIDGEDLAFLRAALSCAVDSQRIAGGEAVGGGADVLVRFLELIK